MSEFDYIFFRIDVRRFEQQVLQTFVVQQVKRGIAFDGTNAISFLMVLVHF